jgi:hypothetical protein
VTRLAYTRCMDGHYYAGEACPLDGHDNGVGSQVAAIAANIPQDELTIDRLREAGVSAEGLAFALVVDYGVNVVPASWVDLHE